ncbi:hypothetical protein [Isoalcanivorax indicus]|uniref:hypothetical protein n=1 Tax=Isoalcanivorax indicus TaxID=2202653 RepID=UPI000DB9B37A|nr:hypothetical protein [Isoalcanivorax indicus]
MPLLPLPALWCACWLSGLQTISPLFCLLVMLVLTLLWCGAAWRRPCAIQLIVWPSAVSITWRRGRQPMAQRVVYEQPLSAVRWPGCVVFAEGVVYRDQLPAHAWRRLLMLLQAA